MEKGPDRKSLHRLLILFILAFSADRDLMSLISLPFVWFAFDVGRVI